MVKGGLEKVIERIGEVKCEGNIRKGRILRRRGAAEK
jgi:hypothetical protein